jgi:hypothetical protein
MMTSTSAGIKNLTTGFDVESGIRQEVMGEIY